MQVLPQFSIFFCMTGRPSGPVFVSRNPCVTVVTIHGPAEKRSSVNRNTLRDAQKLQKTQFRAVKLGIFVQNTHENTSRNGP
jgi:hypothetical protein